MAALSVLCVCTGNICRSPVAERLLVQALGPSVVVSSAGTHALFGASIAAPMVPLLTAASAEPGGFRARQLVPALARGADLVLGLTRDHRADTVEVWPALVRRSFTLKELARLLRSVDPGQLPAEADPGERLRAAIPLAAARRGQMVPASEDDIADPYGQPEPVYTAAFREIADAVHQIAAVVAHPVRR